ncbi:hypothetical protein OFM35_34695, partial [Escherichia coli]|nr:hypothetical protein [Escherichia coli]
MGRAKPWSGHPRFMFAVVVIIIIADPHLLFRVIFLSFLVSTTLFPFPSIHPLVTFLGSSVYVASL